MRVYAYTITTAILIALLVGLGWLYTTKKIETTDSIIMFIVTQVMGVWVGLTNKIYRIITPGNKSSESN